MLTPNTRNCPSCALAFIPEPPADPICTRCGHHAAPHHSTWPNFLKWWLMKELARRTFFPWLSTQVAWEKLLKDAVNGTRFGAHANRDDAAITLSTSAATIYPLALARAERWKEDGSSIALDQGASVALDPVARERARMAS